MKTSLILFSCFVALISCTREAPEVIHFEQKDDKPLTAAKVLGQDISMDELLDGARLEYFQIQNREYRFKKDRLNQVIRNKLLAADAKKKNISVDELLDKHILKGPVTVTTVEVDRFIKEKYLDKKQVDPGVRKQLEEFLVVQKREKKINAYLVALAAKSPAEIYFKRPTFIWPNEKIIRPSIGSPQAKIRIVEVSDFQCDACRKTATKVKQLREKLGSNVEVSYLYLPGENRTEGRSSALAALCGFQQNAKSFWKYHDLLIALDHVPSNSEIINLGAKAGLNKETLESCLVKQESAITLREHFNFANALGVRASPVIIVNGEVFAPDTSLEEIIAQSKLEN